MSQRGQFAKYAVLCKLCVFLILVCALGQPKIWNDSVTLCQLGAGDLFLYTEHSALSKNILAQQQVKRRGHLDVLDVQL